MKDYKLAYEYIYGLLNCDEESMRWPLTIDSMAAFKKLVDKATPMKRKFVNGTPAISAHDICPVCEAKVGPLDSYCSKCGQRLE